MADRCASTAICSNVDRRVFETLGYQFDPAQVLNIDGKEIPGAVVMVDEQAAGGHYDELTALKGLPFIVSNTACPGAFGDHLIVSDGREFVYTEALADSNYPAVRVNPGGEVLSADLMTARSYWQVHTSALKTFAERAPGPGGIARRRR